MAYSLMGQHLYWKQGKVQNNIKQPVCSAGVDLNRNWPFAWTKVASFKLMLNILFRLFLQKRSECHQRLHPSYVLWAKHSTDGTVSNEGTFALSPSMSNLLIMQSERGSDEYGGPEPFSEPQTRVVNNVLETQATAFVNLHSGEWAMYMPWDSKDSVAENLPVSPAASAAL